MSAPVHPAFTDLLLDSFRRLVGRPLVDAGETADAGWLCDATSFCLLAHGTGPASATGRTIHIAKSSRRFEIEGAVIWNLVDRAGVLHGRAATVRKWPDAV